MVGDDLIRTMDAANDDDAPVSFQSLASGARKMVAYRALGPILVAGMMLADPPSEHTRRGERRRERAGSHIAQG